jgi:hypothetical protein
MLGSESRIIIWMLIKSMRIARYTIFVCFLNQLSSIVVKNVEIYHCFGLWEKVQNRGIPLLESVIKVRIRPDL